MIDPLMFVIGVLGLIEICLGIVFYKVGQKMLMMYTALMELHNDFLSAKSEMVSIKDKLNALYVYAKTLGTGSVHLKGEVPMFGKIDLDLELGKKEDK